MTNIIHEYKLRYGLMEDTQACYDVHPTLLSQVNTTNMRTCNGHEYGAILSLNFWTKEVAKEHPHPLQLATYNTHPTTAYATHLYYGQTCLRA